MEQQSFLKIQKNYRSNINAFFPRIVLYVRKKKKEKKKKRNAENLYETGNETIFTLLRNNIICTANYIEKAVLFDTIYSLRVPDILI